jgi:3-methyladenine DNA glycosylase AlkD
MHLILASQEKVQPQMNMDAKKLYKEIAGYCLANADESMAQKYSRYFKEGYNAYGLTQSQINRKAKELLKDKNLQLPEALGSFPMAASSGKYEEVSIVLLVVNGLHKHYSHETFNTISSWFSIGINNWAHADTLGMYILPKFLQYSILSVDDFGEWLTSPYKFQRRCVPVTMIKLLKTSDSLTRYFDFLEPLMIDPAREVHQGMGWFLREAWQLQKEETEMFLEKWKDVSPRLIFQYACEKMSKDEKSRFKRTKSQLS